MGADRLKSGAEAGAPCGLSPWWTGGKLLICGDWGHTRNHVKTYAIRRRPKMTKQSGDWDELVRALAAAVRVRSLRQVAREVGISPTGLAKILRGSEPMRSTIAKVELWRVREAAMSPEPRSDDVRMMAARALARADGIPGDVQEAVAEWLVRAADAVKDGVPPPPMPELPPAGDRDG